MRGIKERGREDTRIEKEREACEGGRGGSGEEGRDISIVSDNKRAL